jgi:hypothetical protein
MRSILPDWEIELARWLKPFLEQLGHKARRRMCPLYVAGLIGPGDRKSVQPMAERLAPGDYDQLHHFVAAGVWDAGPLETRSCPQRKFLARHPARFPAFEASETHMATRKPLTGRSQTWRARARKVRRERTCF